jgi:outer membrane protein TolC
MLAKLARFAQGVRLDAFATLATLTTTLVASPAIAQAEPAQTLTYDAFLDAVAQRHPERSIDEAGIAASRRAEDRAGVLADPQLSVGRDDVPMPRRAQRVMVDEADRDEAQWKLTLSQTFPWPGTLAAEKRAAAARTAAVDASAGLAAYERRFHAAEVFLRIVRTAKMLAAQRANLAVVDGIRNFAHEKFRQGIGSHMEFLQTHSESGVLRANIAAMETDLENLQRHALLLMGDDGHLDPAAVAFVADWPEALVRPSTTAASEPPATDLAREDILRREADAVAARAAASRRSLPSITASGMLMQDDAGMRMYGAMVGVAVPLFSGTQRRALADETSQVERGAAGNVAWHDRRRDLAVAQTQARIAQLESTLASLRRDLIPPVREHIEGATAQFSQGKGELSEIIQGRRTLLQLEVTEVQMMETLARSNLGLERIRAGFVDDTLDEELPQLEVPGTAGAMSGGMGSSSSSSSSSSMGSMRGRATGTRRDSRAPMPQTPTAPPMQDDDGAQPGGASGMGM